MKVLLIGNAGSIHIRRWATGLAERGLKVALLSRKQVPIEDVCLFSSEIPPWAPWRPARWAHRRRGVIRRVLREVNPDVVNVHYLGPYQVFPDDLNGSALVVNTWGSDVIPLELEAAEEKEGKVAVLHAADRVMSTSDHLAQATRRYSGLPPERVITNHWGIDLKQFVPSDQPAQEPVVGFVKAFEPHYNPDILLRAFAQVRRKFPKARLLMAGRGSMETALRQLAEELGIAPHVDWLGQVRYEEVPALFARMSVSAMPSSRDAFGVAAVESQAMKTPVVAANIGGIPETIVDGKTGILVPARDVDALAEALVKILADQRLRVDMGEQARDYVEKHFDWRDTVDRMVATYQEAISEKSDW